MSGRPVDQPFGYRPHLDGLRTVAVYLVLLFHAGVGRASGGFVGVDVFFVLSGYLVTRLLLIELDGGGVRLGRFYARRVRRLLPAAIVVLLVTAAVYPVLATPAEVDEVMRSFQAALLYVSNWHFIGESSDYFSADTDSNPVLHYWSLSVEEQFYIAWPLMLTGLHLLTRHRRRPQLLRVGMVAAAALTSAAWALHLARTDPLRAYYGTDARAYQLLAGALLALILARMGPAVRVAGRLPTVAAGAAVAGILVVSTSLVEVGPITRGCIVTVLTVALLGAVEVAPDGAVARLLGIRPMVELGRLSYATYLWHWPLIVVGGLALERTLSPVSTFVAVGLLATALASLSQTLLELPIRRNAGLDRRPGVVVAAGVAAGVVAAVALVPAWLDPDRSGPVVASGSTIDADAEVALDSLELDRETARTDVGPDLQDVPFLDTWSCLGQPSEACTIVEGDGLHVLVVGDSHAWSLFATFAQLATEDGLTLSTAAAGGCPWQRDLYQDEPDPQGCEDFKRDLYERVLPELDPDLVVAASNDYLGPSGRPGFVVRDGAGLPDGLSGDEAFEWATSRGLDALTEHGASVLLLAPMPSAADDALDPFACLGAAATIDECRFVAPVDERVAAIYRSAAEGRDVRTADLDLLVCPGHPICDPVVNGEVVRLDREHLTPRFAVTLVAPIRELLLDLGLTS